MHDEKDGDRTNSFVEKLKYLIIPFLSTPTTRHKFKSIPSSSNEGSLLMHL